MYHLTTGSYDELTGNLELEPVKGKPEVFVLSGNGCGTAVFRRLQREGRVFAAGILWENDLDYPSAKALAAEVVSIQPFDSIDEMTLAHARELIDQCDEVIFAMDETMLGEWNQKMRGLYEYAKKQGKQSL